MNLREIKKDVEYVLAAFVEDCNVAAALGTDAEKIAALYEEAIDLYNDVKDRISAKVEGPKAAYYQALRKELLEKTNALYEKLSEVVRGSKATK